MDKSKIAAIVLFAVRLLARLILGAPKKPKPPTED